MPQAAALQEVSLFIGGSVSLACRRAMGIKSVPLKLEFSSAKCHLCASGSNVPQACCYTLHREIVATLPRI